MKDKGIAGCTGSKPRMYEFRTFVTLKQIWNNDQLYIYVS